MNIQTIYIRKYHTSHIICTENRLFHQKSLPYLTIVQALEGSYGVRLDSTEEQLTGTMGCFIAPADKMQYINHYVNCDSGIMQAHYILLDVILNGLYRMDDVLDFPVLLPPEYREEVCTLIDKVEKNDNLCDNLSYIYKLVKILLNISSFKNDIDHKMNEIKQYISQRYADKIAPEQLAGHFGLSVPTLYRKFKKFQGLTPANYINAVRLGQAAKLLEITGHPVGEICKMVGIEDVFYFSKLFKSKYGVSPMYYRKQVK